MRDTPMVFVDESETFDEIDTISEFTTSDGNLPVDIDAKIRGIVEESFNRHIADIGQTKPLEWPEINILWVTKTGDDWTALVSTFRKNGKFFELVYDGPSATTTVNIYNQVRQERIADSDR